MNLLELLNASKGDLFSAEDGKQYILVRTEGDGGEVTATYQNLQLGLDETDIIVRGEYSYVEDMFKNEMKKKIHYRDMLVDILNMDYGEELLKLYQASAKIRSRK